MPVALDLASEDGSGALASTPSGSLYLDPSSPSATARQHCEQPPSAYPCEKRDAWASPLVFPLDYIVLQSIAVWLPIDCTLSIPLHIPPCRAAHTVALATCEMLIYVVVHGTMQCGAPPPHPLLPINSAAIC